MNQSGDNFSRFIYISVGFHFVIFLFLTVKILFFPSEAMEYQRSVRVDVVALPEKIKTPAPVKKEEAPKAAPKKEEVKKPEPKPKPKKKEVVKPKIKKAPKKVVTEKKKVKEDQNSAIARLKALQKIKNKKGEAASKKEFKGNAISKGTSLTGIEKLHHNSYLDQLDEHIRSQWNLPEWLDNGNLKAVVLLLINKNGSVKGKQLTLKSGNDFFDELVLGTIEKANPLPAPPSNLVDFYSSKGVEIRFPE